MGVTTLMPAAGGTSLVCYLLMTRAQNRGTPAARSRRGQLGELLQL